MYIYSTIHYWYKLINICQESKQIKPAYRNLPCIRHTHVFGPNFQEKKFLVLIFKFNYSFVFRHKTNYRIPGYYFAYGYRYCFLKLRFQCISINKTIKNIYVDTELVLPMYSVHPYFSFKILDKNVCIIYSKIR